jgi:hypothetical protein
LTDDQAPGEKNYEQALGMYPQIEHKADIALVNEFLSTALADEKDPCGALQHGHRLL